MSGVQQAATGPANRPTHTAQPQVHTAADLRGNIEKDACQSAGLSYIQYNCLIGKNGEEKTEADIWDAKMYEGNAGKILPFTCKQLRIHVCVCVCV